VLLILIIYFCILFLFYRLITLVSLHWIEYGCLLFVLTFFTLFPFYIIDYSILAVSSFYYLLFLLYALTIIAPLRLVCGGWLFIFMTIFTLWNFVPSFREYFTHGMEEASEVNIAGLLLWICFMTAYVAVISLSILIRGFTAFRRLLKARAGSEQVIK